MAIAYITIGDAVTRDILNGATARSEAVTTSGTAASGALTATRGQVALIYCATSVYARSGGTVTVATGVLCPGGIQTPIAMVDGTAVSLIDA